MTAIYLDHAATTPLHHDVLESMMPLLTGQYGNPSSQHSFGRKAKQALTDARDSIASFLGCLPGQLFFTSGGTESDNTAIIGTVSALKSKGKTHIITTAIEHHAVLHAAQQLERMGCQVTYAPVDEYGQVSVDAIAAAITPQTALVSVMYANNEVGTVQPIGEIGRICRERGVLFHVDAVQALGHLPIDLAVLPVDLMSFSGHKIGAMKGVGLLYIARHVHLQPLLFGGSQERKKRPGTENVPGIVGLATAVSMIPADLREKMDRFEWLRKRFLQELSHQLGMTPDGPDVITLNGHPSPEQRLSSIVNISFNGIDKETMLMHLDLAGIAASGGSACTSGSLEDSHVLMAMGLSSERVKSAIRFSFGAGHDEAEIVEAAHKIGTIANRLRKP